MSQNKANIWKAKPRTDTSIRSCVFSPNDDDDEVEQVPAIADVGAGVHHQTVGQDFQEGLHSEDDEEDVLHLFLKHRENMFLYIYVFVRVRTDY